MEIAIAITFLSGFIGMACLLPFAFFLSYRLCKRLEKEHHAVWFELGQPAFPGNAGIITQRRTRKWLKANYARVDDPKLESWYVKLRKITWVYYGFGLLALSGFILMVVHANT